MPEAAGEAGAPLVEAQVRTDFRSTVFWQPSIVTDADGQATVEITYPDSLTEWKATARAVDKETRVGWESAETRTKKDVIVRLQAPRFFVEGDEAVISANVHNYTSEDQVAVVTLDLKGLELVKAESSTSSTPSTVSTVSTEPVPAAALKIEIGVAKDGERRVDWRCKVGKKGEATIRATAQTTVDSDAMEKKYPILEHGIEKFIAESGKLGGGAEAKGAASNTVFQMTLPAERKPEADSLVVQLSPSLAATMVGALDYLADYPYGCVEQTLSRFVPTVITAGTLRQLGLSNPELEKKIPDMVKAGLDRLRDFQHGDGGWAWWKEGDSDPYMTAYVVYGLTLAKEAGVDVPQPMLDGGIRCLNDLIIKCERQPDMLAWCLHALSYSKQLGDTARKMLDVAWVRRGELNPYTRALLLITFHNLGDKEKESILVENMENGVVFDEQTGTAHWGKSGVFYRWSDGGIEATAFAIKALLAADPQNPRIDQAMLWMVKNRRAARWTNTKDTAIAVYALADYIRVRGEAKPEYDAKVIVNGKEAATFHVDPDNVFKTDGKIEVPASMLQSGKNEIRIEKTGAGALYYSAYLTYYTLEDPIKAAGSEIFVDREYYKLTDKPTVAGEVKTEREKIEPGAPVNSGDRIEVVLNVDAKNDYEYLVFEDYKAAGLEPVDIKSGYEFKDGMSVYREFRDERTALFVSSMKQGKHKLTYTLRAEVPGHFSALPALAHAMYIPEIRANADEFKFEVGEKKAE
ncbi:MAG: hypothetical protein NTW86_04760 [Candidatus Sumerlaeota bacterium]|nr:hypothetical protein [Candidatus Sumerlaeota bacterium]